MLSTAEETYHEGIVIFMLSVTGIRGLESESMIGLCSNYKVNQVILTTFLYCITINTSKNISQVFTYACGQMYLMYGSRIDVMASAQPCL